MGLRETDITRRWPDGLVPYEIDSGFSAAQRQEILDAIDLVNRSTNATFAPRDGEADFARFAPASGSCGTRTGRDPGANTISCDLSTFSTGNVAHEMLHELGHHHEHVREDRDTFVTIQWANIQADRCGNFKRKVDPEPANYDDCADTYDPATQTLRTEDVGTYDYGSIMHYGETFFLASGATGQTITPINPAGAAIGQRAALSDGDIATVNDTYDTAAIYVRDNLTDDGEEPLVGGGLSRSPDIIHVPDEPADAQTLYSTPAAMAADNLSEDVEFGQTNFVYVRLQKNGTLTDTANVDLYWTEPSTLPSPTSWTQIGTTQTEAAIAPGEIRIVGPFLFNDVPAEGHYCFVAVVGSRKNPAPDLASISTGSDFHDLVRAKSNLAWKNFDVVNVEEGGDTDMDFHVQNMRGRSDDNSLELDLSSLPASVTAHVRMVSRLAKAGQLRKLQIAQESARQTTMATTGSFGVHAIDGMTLPSRDDTIVRLSIDVPEGTPHGAYDISARQTQNGREVGRVTRRLTVGRFPFIGNRRSMELHRANCPWIPKMSPRNKVPFDSLERGLRRGFDGCHTCLEEEDNG